MLKGRRGWVWKMQGGRNRSDVKVKEGKMKHAKRKIRKGVRTVLKEGKRKGG